jgi:acetyltransferase-like isoleucine patch superfamily enzyme
MKLLQEFTVEQVSVNDKEVLVLELFFKDGDYVSKDDVICEYETSKAVVTVESECDGYIRYHASQDEMIAVGSVICEIYDETVQAGTGAHKTAGEQKLKEIEVVEETDQIADPAPVLQVHTMHENLAEFRVENTFFSIKAEELLKNNKIDKAIFSNEDFVNVTDVLNYINTLDSRCLKSSDEKPNHAILDKEGITRKERIVVFCPSEYGMQVIWDIIKTQPDKHIVGYVTDDKYKDTMDLDFLNCNVFNFHEKIDKREYDSIIIALGGSLKSMQFRKKVYDFYKEKNIQFSNLISDDANIRDGVRMGQGNIIGSGVFIGAHSIIGENNFISYMTCIGHHNKIGNCNLFAPGVMMSGLVEIGDNCILTTGVNFIDKVKLGSNVILPLGYNVVRNLPDNTVIKIK